MNIGSMVDIVDHIIKVLVVLVLGFTVRNYINFRIKYAQDFGQQLTMSQFIEFCTKEREKCAGTMCSHFQQLETNLKEGSSEFKTIGQSLVQLKTTLEHFDSTITSIRSSIHANKSAINELQKKVGVLETRLDNQ